MVILYVDNLIILTSNVIKLKWFKSELEKQLKTSDPGELHYCLGVEFWRNREAHTSTMNQRSYIEEALKRFNIEKCNPVGSPFDANSKFLKLLDEEFRNV